MSRFAIMFVVLGVVICTSVDSGKADVAGSALLFDGNDSVRIPHSSDFKNLSEMTVEFWVKYDSSEDGQYIIDQFGTSPANTGEWLVRTMGGNTSFYYRWPGETECTTTTTTTDGDWHHISITKSSGSNFNYYVDGQFDRFFYAGHPVVFGANVDMYFGSRGNYEQFFRGTLDEMRIWNYARSEEEITNSWNRTVDPSSAGLLGYWNFDEQINDQNVLDSSPLSHHGSLGGTYSAFGDDPLRVPSTAPLVPEPSSMLLLLGLSGMITARRRSRSRSTNAACG